MDPAAAGPLPSNQITVYETSGVMQRERPISIARAFRRGDVPHFAEAVIAGHPVLTQCDVKNRWPDGSVKFAVVSFVIPTLASNSATVVAFADQPDGHNAGALTGPEMLDPAFDFDGRIELQGRWSAAVSARAMLAAGHWRYWLRGPIVTAVIIEDRTAARSQDTDVGDGSKALHPIFEAWFYPQDRSVDLGYTLENTWASSDPHRGMRDVSYRLTLRSGHAAPRIELVHPRFRHIGASRWHKRYWLPAPPASIRVDHNTAYLASTAAIPNYDTAIPVAESLLASVYRDWTGAPKGLAGQGGALGSYATRLNVSGASPWIGLLTTWDTLYLLTMDDRMREMALGNADLAGRMPWHFREADSRAGTGQYFDAPGTGRVDTLGRVVSVNARRTVSLWDLGPGSDCGEAYRRDRINTGPISGDGWQTTRDHMPDTAYLAYLLTGRYYYLEELQYLAAFMVAHKVGCYRDGEEAYHRQGHNGFLHDSQVRGDAWAFRTLSYAAFLSPDETPERAYFEDKLLNNIAAWEGEHDLPLSDPTRRSQWAWAARYRDPRGPSPLGLWQDQGPDLVQSPVATDGRVMTAVSGWEEHFLVIAFGMARGFGYPTDGLLRFMAKLRFNLLLNPAANRFLIEAYRWPAKLAATRGWAQTYAAFGTYFSTSMTGWEPIRTADHDYGLIALAAVSYLTPYTVDGFDGSAAWALYKGERPGQERFATDSPKWAILPLDRTVADASPPGSARAAWPGPSVCPAGPVLSVGPTRPLLVPSWAARCAKDGDTVEIDAATYERDAAVWRASNLTLRGVGGRPHLEAAGAHAEGKAIWVIKGRNTTVENVEFSGATVPDGNGAAIRLEGRDLTVRRAYFHDNEMGILTGADAESHVLIEDSEFSRHGSDDGRNHNIYIGAVGRFTLRSSYVHHARIGHNVKSRARETFILYNRIMDEVDGNSSYAVDIPNGGRAYVIGNLIQHGPRAENSTIVSYGAEGLTHPDNQLYVINNTFVNDRAIGGTFIGVSGRPSVIRVVNNIFAGPGTVVSAPAELRSNLISAEPGLRDRAHFDYRLKPTSPAIGAGADPGSANGVPLTPTAQYVHKATSEPRPALGRVDIGAYEHPTSGRR